LTPRVLLIHGAFCGGWAFDRFRRRLEAAGWDCLAPDLPGHGPGSDPNDVARLSMSDYASAVRTLIDAEPCPPILVGHSMGGLVAQLAATQTAVAALALLAPSAPWGIAGQSLEEAVSAFGLYALGPYWTQPVAPDRSLARLYSLDRMAPDEAEGALERMCAESGRALFETLNWWLDPFLTTRVDASRINCPVYAAVGEADIIHPPATVRQTAAKLGVSAEVFPNMSHWLIGEVGFEAVADACLSFFETGLALRH